MNEISSEIFAKELAEALAFAKLPELFERKVGWPERDCSEIRILRRWNSHSPVLWDVLGGGYYLRWGGRGTVVDPGCGFLRLLQDLTPYGLSDINLVAVTHDHVDHCQDLGSLISMLRQFNKHRHQQHGSAIPHTLDLLVSYGAAAQFHSHLTHPENEPFLRWGKVFPPGRIDRVRAPPGVARDDNIVGWPRHLAARCYFYRRKLKKDYQYTLTALPAKHRELLGDNTSMGLRFDLARGSLPCSIVISGDTGLDASEVCGRRESNRLLATDLLPFYENADLLILHVGTMEQWDAAKGALNPEEEHLGSLGVVKVLLALVNQTGVTRKHRLPKAVVLTEWGYEFGRLGLHGRSRFTELVVQELEARGCGCFFAATTSWRAASAGRIPILPADVGLRLRLPDLSVCTSAGQWVAPDRIRAQERCPEILYHEAGLQ